MARHPSVFNKIYKGVPLSFNEEYAMEGLWHEILHNTAKGYQRYRKGDIAYNTAEFVNQFVARHTYPRMMRLIGTEARLQGEVLERGYGYNSRVQMFRKELKLAGLDEKAMADGIEKILLTKKQGTLNINLAKYLSKESGKSQFYWRRVIYDISSKNTNQ